MSILDYDFMVRALLAAFFTGLAAPAVGTYLVQRRLALMGDGIGHIAVTGVGLGLLTGTSPVWTAVGVTILGALLIELVRERGRTSGDVALALIFYGGIAGGVMVTGLAGGSAQTLQSYLFGSITTVTVTDVWTVVALAAAVIFVAIGFAPQLFAVCQDEDFAKVAGSAGPLLQPAHVGDGGGHGDGGDAHCRAVARQRAHGRPGRHRAAANPGIQGDDPGGDGARRACLARRGGH